VAAALCNDAQLLPPEDERAGWSVLGDPTEGALLVLACKAGLVLDLLRRDAPREAELPFDSDTKLMATRHRMAGAPRRVWIKGAPEAVLRLCAGGDGAALQAPRDAAERMATQALRVLAFATVDEDALDPAGGFDALAGRARLLGLVGQIDPPREEVKLSVADCRAAGIRPIMVTGDHKLTGLAIARELGIARDGERAVDGPELERMGEADLRDELPGIAVFARVQPAQKLRIVEALQARGEVVAMTGDGVNDAPALARADVGVAMGITGTEVAKSAAKIVITDDNFSTIVGAVQQGRVVYANLKKVILYLFATSMAEVLVLLLALLGGFPLPLVAVQILWINIVTEGTVTVNLVMDPADGDEMRRAPVPRDDRLLGAEMLKRVALMTPLIAGVTFGWFAWRLGQGAPLEIVRTETFTVLAMCQWFNVLNCQSARASALGLRIVRNRWLLGGLTLSVAAAGAGAVRTADECAVPHRAAAAGVAAAAAGAGQPGAVGWRKRASCGCAGCPGLGHEPCLAAHPVHGLRRTDRAGGLRAQPQRRCAGRGAWLGARLGRPGVAGHRDLPARTGLGHQCGGLRRRPQPGGGQRARGLRRQPAVPGRRRRLQRHQPMYREASATHLLSAGIRRGDAGVRRPEPAHRHTCPGPAARRHLQPDAAGAVPAGAEGQCIGTSVRQWPSALQRAARYRRDRCADEWRRFGVAALVVLAAGSWLPKVADGLATTLGLSEVSSARC
jgi:phosphoserine phosphatase